jgi:superoxide reductase
MGTEKINQVYRCEVCGNIIEVLHVGGGELVCCGKPMILLVEKEKDSGMEKHIPVIEKTDSGIKVKIGSIEHPMLEEHYIECIEIIANGKTYKEFLKPGMKPEAEFCVSGDVQARAYCNVHGLWSSFRKEAKQV